MKNQARLSKNSTCTTNCYKLENSGVQDIREVNKDKK